MNETDQTNSEQPRTLRKPLGIVDGRLLLLVVCTAASITMAGLMA